MSNRFAPVSSASGRLAAAVACVASLTATTAFAQAAPAQSAAAQSAAAQSAPAKAPEASAVAPVTVHAAPSEALMQKEAQAFVQSYTATTPELAQVARWLSPICVQVSGLTPDQSAQVARRIGKVAEGVGMHVLSTGCTANIEVVFTDQPQRFMDRVADTREEILGYYHRSERNKLKTVTRPIQAWYVTGTRGRGGSTNVGLVFANHGGDVPLNGTSAVQSHREVIDDPENPRPAACGDSAHFTICLSSVLRNVLVVVDSNKVKGQDVGLVADYLSMLTLSRPRSLDGCSQLSSVIDALSPTCQNRSTPDGLTPADAAYLTSLYTADTEANGTHQESDIAARMASILTKKAGS
jgi:hypothetical protein